MCGGGTDGGSSNDNSYSDIGLSTTTTPTSNSSWGAGDLIDQGPGQPGSPSNIADAQAAAANAGFGNAPSAENLPGEGVMTSREAQPSQTFDRENGWGLSFGDRVAYGGFGTALSSGSTNFGGVGGFIGNRIDRFMDNPIASLVDLAFSFAPGANAVVGAAKAANSISNMFGGPTLGSLTQSAVRGETQIGEAPGSAPGASTNPAGAFDGGGNASGGWNSVLDGLDVPTSPDTAPSTAPTTVSSIDPRSAYGFSPGQGVDYAELSDGFGGSNTGARSGWRRSGIGGWA